METTTEPHRALSIPLTVSRPQLLTAGNDKLFRQFVHDSLAFSARLQDVRSRFAELVGLSAAGYSILITVYHLQEDGIGINQVATHLHLSGAFVTNEVGKLIKLGWVQKRIDSADRRRVILTVTAKGAKALAKLAPTQAPVNDELFSGLSPQEFRQLAKIMAKLADCCDRALELLAFLTNANKSKVKP